MSEWISVKDRLPPERVPVLAIYLMSVGGYAALITVEWSRQEGWTSYLPLKEGLRISYWTEQPVTPKIWWE